MRAAWARITAHPRASGAIFFAVLSLLFVSPALVPGRVLSNSDSLRFQPPWNAERPADLVRPANPEVGDGPSVIQPFVRFSKQTLPHLPLWNPHIVGGRPFLANAQSAIFSPFNAPAYVMPYYESLAWTFAMKLFLASFGMFLLARALSMRDGAALLAGLVFGFNTWMVAWQLYPHSAVWVLIPWLLLAVEYLVRRPDLVTVSALSALVGVQFLGGHPESSFHAMVAAVAFFAVRAFPAARRQDGKTWRRIGAFVGASVLGTVLAALVLLPFVELLLGSADLAQRSDSAKSGFTEPRYLLGLALPYYWGKPTGTPIETFFVARAVYAGALPLLLAFVAIMVRPRGIRAAVAGFGAVCMAVVFAVKPVFQIVTALPVFSSGHNTRLVALYMVCVALLAGWGADDLASRRLAGRRRTITLAVCGVAIVGPIAWVVANGTFGGAGLGEAARVAWTFAKPPAATEAGAFPTIRMASVLGWLPIIGAVTALLVLATRPRGLPAVVFAVAALTLTAGDLALVGMGNNPAVDREHAEQPLTGGIRFLQSRRPDRFVSGQQIPQDVIPMNFGLYEARGYDLPIERRYDRLWRSRVSPEYPSQNGSYPQFIPLSLPRVTKERLRILGLLGVRDVLDAPDAPPLRGKYLRVAYRGRDATIYENKKRLPRAFVVGAQSTATSGRQALDRFTGRRFDARDVAVTESRVPGLPVADSARRAGSARIVRYGADRVRVSATATRPGMLVLSDNWAPGWKVKVDGQEQDLHRVDYVLRGVRLAPGRHQVEFAYQPLSWRIGWITSLVALLLVTAMMVVGRRRRRRQTRGGPAPAAG